MSILTKPSDLSSIGGAPNDATYYTLQLEPGLSAERRLVFGTGIGSVDGGANGDLTLTNTGTLAQALTNGNITGGNNIALSSGDIITGATGVDVVLQPPSASERVIVRQPGGSPGTDEVQIYDDGTNGWVQSMNSGNLLIASGTGGGTQVVLRTSAGNRLVIDSSQCELGVATIPSGDNTLGLGNTSRRWANVYAATITGRTAAADADGDDIIIIAPDGGAHTSNDPNGGDIICTPGALGAGGAGTNGRVIVREPGGVAGTDEGSFRIESARFLIDTPLATAEIRIAGSQVLQVDSAQIQSYKNLMPYTDNLVVLGYDVPGASSPRRWSKLLVGIVTGRQAVADTDGDDITIGGSNLDGGTHSASNPNGGDVILQPGAKGSGGAGSDGLVIVRQPGGVAGTDEIQISNNGSRTKIEDKAGGLLVQSAGWIDWQNPGGTLMELSYSPNTLYCIADKRTALGTTSARWASLYVDTITGRNAAADTDGDDIAITASTGGAHSASNPAGGNITLTGGAAGSGGSGAGGSIKLIPGLLATGGVDGSVILYDADGSTKRIETDGTGIGFFTATPIAQPSATGETTGFTAGAGTGVNDDSTFTGNVGATAYRVNDIVKHLKNLGLIAS